MHPSLLLLLCAALFGAPSVLFAQEVPSPAPAAPASQPADTPIPSDAATPPVAEPAPHAQTVDTIAPEAPVAAAPANAATSTGSTPPEAAAVTPSVPVASAPAAPLADKKAGATTSDAPPADAQAEMFAASVNLMEQLFRAQHEREASLYRDTIRLVMIFGGAFAALCMIGLLAAAFLNYRALLAVQNMSARMQSTALAAPTNGMFPASSAVPGIERVQASGQRFQSRMSGLEQRLAELEHLTGREPTSGGGNDVVETVSPTEVVSAETAGLASPPAQEVPRAMILVHKAQALANLGKLTEALATLDEASAFDGAKTEVHLARGQVLEKLGRLGDALRAYDTAVGADDHNTSALLLKAGVLNRQERFSEALACYERALEVHRTASSSG
jgi:tetratricopeptide (TPR) repeat protein